MLPQFLQIEVPFQLLQYHIPKQLRVLRYPQLLIDRLLLCLDSPVAFIQVISYLLITKTFAVFQSNLPFGAT